MKTLKITLTIRVANAYAEQNARDIIKNDCSNIKLWDDYNSVGISTNCEIISCEEIE